MTNNKDKKITLTQRPYKSITSFTCYDQRIESDYIRG